MLTHKVCNELLLGVACVGPSRFALVIIVRSQVMSDVIAEPADLVRPFPSGNLDVGCWVVLVCPAAQGGDGREVRPAA